MRLLKLIIKGLLFSIPFLGFLVVPVAIGELVPIQSVVEQQQKSESSFIYGPQFIWRDHLFAYRVESINYLKPDVMVLGSSRTTQIRSQVFNKQPDTFSNASLEGYGLRENAEMIFDIQEDALPELLLLGMNQNFLKSENSFQGDTRRPTQLHNEILIDEIILGTTLRTYEDLFTDREFVPFALEAEPIFPDTIHFGTRVYTYGHGYLQDGSARNRALEEWGDNYINTQLQEDYYELTNRVGKFSRGNGVNQDYLDLLEEILQYAQVHDITVVGFLPPYDPEFYDEIVISDDFAYMFEASKALEALYTQYGAYYFDFTSPYYFQLGERAFRDSWHTSDFVLSQIVMMMAWAEPELFEPYLSLDVLADDIANTIDPNRMFFSDAEYVRSPDGGALSQLIKAGIEWDASLLPAIHEYNRALFSPSKQDDFDDSVQIISQVIELYPDLTSLFLWRAQVYFRTGQIDLLVEDVRTALEIDSDASVPVRLLGTYLANSGEEGLTQINDVIERNPDASWAYLARADLYFSFEDYHLSSNDYLVAYQLDRSIESRDGYVNSLIALDDIDGVLTFMNSALQGVEEDLRLLDYRADIYAQLGLYDEAVADYQRAYILTDETHSIYIIRQGDVYFLAEQYQRALETYERVVDLLVNPSFIYSRIGEVYIEMGDIDNAFNYFQQSITVDPNNPTPYIRIMSYYDGVENYEQAIEYATRAINTGSANAWVYARRANYYSGIGNYEATLQDYLLASEIEPENLGYHYSIGDTLLTLGQDDEAKGWLESAVTADAPSVGAFARLADLYEADENFQGAADLMHQALELYPDAEWLKSRLERYENALLEVNANINVKPDEVTG